LRPWLSAVEKAWRPAVRAVLDRFEHRVTPELLRMRAQVVHNDLAPNNVLVDDTLAVTGITDFGDMTHTALVCDLAVAPADALPVHLVGGRGLFLEGADGRRYLDAYNNVPVLGHSHPAVVEAVCSQLATLNTNSRYLQEAPVELAERLLATLPARLDRVLLVNSGSEANDLAWRIARHATGASGGIVTSWAYHGVTEATFAFSPESWGDNPPPP